MAYFKRAEFWHRTGCVGPFRASHHLDEEEVSEFAFGTNLEFLDLLLQRPIRLFELGNVVVDGTGLCSVQELSCPRRFFCSMAVGEKTVVANADETFGKHMEQNSETPRRPSSSCVGDYRGRSLSNERRPFRLPQTRACGWRSRRGGYSGRGI